jgi:hypothetical protein
MNIENSVVFSPSGIFLSFVYRSKYSIHASGSSDAVPLNGLGAKTDQKQLYVVQVD